MSPFESYTKRYLTQSTDRAVAIAGLEHLVAEYLDTDVKYGTLENYLHRSLMWQRVANKTLERIHYPRPHSEFILALLAYN